jgi:hypothetical protein
MTEPAEGSRRGIWSRYFRGRRPGPLVGPWVSSLIFAGLVYYLERTMPALHDVVGLIYWLLIAIVVVTTGRWVRARSAERRGTDRRRVDRREQQDD